MERLAKMVETVPGVTTAIKTPLPYESDAFPTLTVLWDEKKFGLTVSQCNQKLRGQATLASSVQTNENASGVLARIKTPSAPFGIGRPTKSAPSCLSPCSPAKSSSSATPCARSSITRANNLPEWVRLGRVTPARTTI